MNSELNLFALPFNKFGAIQISYSPLLEVDVMAFDKQKKTLYHNMPYKLYLWIIYKDDLDKGLEECFKFAKEKLFERIDKLNC